LNRVLGDGVFGVEQHRPPHIGGHGAWPGIVVVTLMVGLVVTLAVGHARPPHARLLFPATLAALSPVTFAMPFILNAKTIAAIANPFSGGRYYVTAVLFLICCIAALADQALSGLGRTVRPAP
jgi:hypothetical protein